LKKQKKKKVVFASMTGGTADKILDIFNHFVLRGEKSVLQEFDELYCLYINHLKYWHKVIQ